jgi:hypothetical protein
MPIFRALGPALALVALTALAGCSGASLGTGMPHWAGGLPPEAPARGDETPVYPNVQERPPARPTKLISDPEREKIEAELAALRSRTNAQSEAIQKERSGGR